MANRIRVASRGLLRQAGLPYPNSRSILFDIGAVASNSWMTTESLAVSAEQVGPVARFVVVNQPVAKTKAVRPIDDSCAALR